MKLEPSLSRDASDTGDVEVEALARRICAAHGNAPSALLEILHDLRREQGDAPEAALRTIADALNLSRAEVYGVKSFYPDFKRPRSGARVVQVCLAEACRSRGAGALFEAAAPLLEAEGIEVDAVYCLGNCALSPAVMVDGVVHGRVGDAATLMRLAAGEDA